LYVPKLKKSNQGLWWCFGLGVLHGACVSAITVGVGVGVGLGVGVGVGVGVAVAVGVAVGMAEHSGAGDGVL
jgi:hypothetical protein